MKRFVGLKMFQGEKFRGEKMIRGWKEATLDDSWRQDGRRG